MSSVVIELSSTIAHPVVSSLNSLTGALTLVGASGISIAASGTTITISGAAADVSTYPVGPGRTYTTIQAALDAIGNATSVADVQSPKLVTIAGGVYDEDLTIPTGRILTLQAEGTVVLGNGLGANWSSTNTRNISAAYNTADIFGSGARPALNIVAIPDSDATSTFLAQAGSFNISGAITITGDLTRTLNLSSVKLKGALTDASLGLTNILAYKTLFIGAIAAPKAIIGRAEDCEFQALVTILGFNALLNCEVAAGMTVTANENTLPPSGMFFTSFTGTFTGPANSLKVDVTSDYFFRINGATLGGSATRVLLAPTASASVTGVLSSTDWSTFNAKQSALTLTNLTDVGTDGITITNGTGAVVGASPITISQHVADATHNGYLTSTDWSAFNSKQSALSFGNLTDTGTDGITVINGAGAVIGSGTSISQHVADATHNGYLSAADWNTFNSAAGGGLTGLTGDGTATGPGSAALTLATVNSNVGSFTNASVTVNAKGLVTAVSSATTTGSGATVLASGPALTNPTVGTQAALDNSTKAASTAYTDAAAAVVQAFAIQRANQTGTQLASTISDFLATATDPNPGAVSWLFEDYLNENSPMASGTVSGGVASRTASLATAAHPGVWRIRLTTLAGSIFTYWGFKNILLGGGPYTFRASIQCTNLSDGTDDYIVRAGMATNIDSTEPTIGCYFEYDRSVSLNWQLVTVNGGSRTKTASSIAVTNVYQALKIVFNSAGTSAQFFVDGVSAGTQSSNFPSSLVHVLVQAVKRLGNGQKDIYIDYISFGGTQTTTR